MYSELVLAETQGIASYHETDSRKRVIKRSNGKNPNVSSVILVGIYRVVVVFMLVAVAIIFIFKGHRSGNFSFFVFMLMANGLNIVRAVREQRAVAAEESFISVCEGCVYGRAIKKWHGFNSNRTKWFDVGFDMITGVEKREALFSNIRIKCGADTYDCMVNEPDEIIGLIKEKVNHL